jgi:hypothetical protein
MPFKSTRRGSHVDFSEWEGSNSIQKQALSADCLISFPIPKKAISYQICFAFVIRVFFN